MVDKAEEKVIPPATSAKGLVKTKCIVNGVVNLWYSKDSIVSKDFFPDGDASAVARSSIS